MERFSLCPQCIACPEVVIDGDTIRIGEDERGVGQAGRRPLTPPLTETLPLSANP